MKRGKIKKVRKKRRVKKRVKLARKKFARKLMRVILLVIFFLLLGRGLFFILEQVSERFAEEEAELEGELETLKWDFGGENVTLDVLNYALLNNNETINVEINWSSGEGEDLRGILIEFGRSEGPCNYTNDTISGFQNFGGNKTYMINSNETNCEPSNFTNVSGVLAYAQINVPLIQISLIENITLYNDDSWQNVSDLDAYFSCLGEINFEVEESPDNSVLITSLNSENKLSFNLSSGSWYGSQKFNLNATCDGDVLDVNSEGENMTFYVIIINANRPIANNAPDFLSDECYEFEWDMDANLTMDMDNCWEDDDGPEDLEYRYGGLHAYEENISIIELSGNRLKFVPNQSFIGRTYFYIYANDSIDENGNRVYVEVLEISDGGGDDDGDGNGDGNDNADGENPEITSISPWDKYLDIFLNDSLNFSISAKNYDDIRWYVNGKLVASDVISYEFSNLSGGDYIVKVEITKGNAIDSETWDLVVSAEEQPKKKFSEIVSPKIVLIMVMVILGILMLFVVLLIVKNMIEKEEGKKAIIKPPTHKFFSQRTAQPSYSLPNK